MTFKTEAYLTIDNDLWRCPSCVPEFVSSDTTDKANGKVIPICAKTKVKKCINVNYSNKFNNAINYLFDNVLSNIHTFECFEAG